MEANHKNHAKPASPEDVCSTSPDAGLNLNEMKDILEEYIKGDKYIPSVIHSTMLVQEYLFWKSEQAKSKV